MVREYRTCVTDGAGAILALRDAPRTLGSSDTYKEEEHLYNLFIHYTHLEIHMCM